jgi:hypothetical protein
MDKDYEQSLWKPQKCYARVSGLSPRAVKVLEGKNAGEVVRTNQREWHRGLFDPCVATGLIPASALAGYRNDAVYLRNSRYVPPRWEAVRDAMPALLDLIESELEPCVRAVLGHWLFGYMATPAEPGDLLTL